MTRWCAVGFDDGSAHTDFGMSRLEPGGVIPTHIHSFEESFHLVEGEVLLVGEAVEGQPLLLEEEVGVDPHLLPLLQGLEEGRGGLEEEPHPPGEKDEAARLLLEDQAPEVADHRPWKRGGRFSLKARTPSSWSWVWPAWPWRTASRAKASVRERR